MDLSSKAAQNTARRYFKILNRFMVIGWRLGLGPWLNKLPQYAGRYMVITHTGRKSGLKRNTPVNFGVVDGEVYCVSGFGATSDWYLNLKSNPGVEVWLPDGWWAGYAEDVTGRADTLPILRSVLIASGFAGPLFGVDPKTMSDEALQAIAADYRLIHICRTEARTGAGGPGDLAWVWPAATLLLTAALLLRPRSRR